MIRAGKLPFNGCNVKRVTRQLIAFTAANPAAQVFKIDPASGSEALIATLPGTAALNQARALDPASRRFFVLQPTSQLVSTNIDTGQVTAVSVANTIEILEFGSVPVNLEAVPLTSEFLLALAFCLAMVGTLSLRCRA